MNVLGFDMSRGIWTLRSPLFSPSFNGQRWHNQGSCVHHPGGRVGTAAEIGCGGRSRPYHLRRLRTSTMLSNKLCRHAVRGSAVGLCRRPYLSLREMIFGESSHKIEQKRLGTLQLPLAKKLNGRFISPWTSQTEKKARDVLKYLLTRTQMKLNLKTDSIDLIRPTTVDRQKCRGTEKPHCTWIGHATCLYQAEGAFFLTDPLWSERCSPVSFSGPKRYINPPIEIEDLKVDVVLLSHTHFDHLDEKSAVRIGNKALWLVPLGVKQLLAEMGVTNCVELDWWQSHQYLAPNGANIEIIFTPTKHWTARGLFDRNTCLWGSFAVLSPQSRFFFTGDTGYCPVFKQIGDTFGPFDLAAIPIGAYEPRWFMRDVHCNPEEAVQIHLDLKAKRSFGIHWGTFPMADEDPVEPALELARSRDVAKVPVEDFYTMSHGETLYIDESSPSDFATQNASVFGEFLEQLLQHQKKAS